MRLGLFGVWLASWAVVASGGERGDLRIVLTADGASQSAPHGRGNVYAPEVLVEKGVHRMWFGGQGRDGHDRIHLAESADGVAWTRRGVVLEDVTANHVNDPSVVRVGEEYFMYYTRAGSGVRDEIAVATSHDGVAWTPRGVALAPGAEGAWDALLVGRPSVLVEDGVWRMWYDGRKDLPAGALAAGAPTSPGSTRAVGYAESRDGFTWRRVRETPVFESDAGGVHVSRVGERLVMVYESRDGTLAAVSEDGLAWTPRGLLAPKSGGMADAFGHVTPFLHYDAATGEAVLWVGAARSATWDENAIGKVQSQIGTWQIE